MRAACAASGTDYVDLCGEPVWMRKMIDVHEAAAKTSGARFVFSFGFDSIPFDLGVPMLQNEMKAQHGTTANRIRGRVRKLKGTFSGGTAASLKENIGAWVGPFVMAAINTRNVHRSNFLLGHPYGADFVYDEMTVTGTDEKGEARANALANDKSMGSDDGPKPGEGPSKAERDAGHYDALFLGHDASGHTVRVSVNGDPGYGSTSKMIAESAVCLLRDAIDTQGGIWTPAAAMGTKLITRLAANAGLTFAVKGE